MRYNADNSHSISSINEDSSTFTTHLSAQPAPWSDVAGTYELNYGHVKLDQPRQKRGFWHHIKDDISGNFDITKEHDTNIQAGTPGKVDEIYRDDR